MKNSLYYILVLFLVACSMDAPQKSENFNEKQSKEIIEKNQRNKNKRERHKEKIRKIESEKSEINNTNKKPKLNPVPRFDFY